MGDKNDATLGDVTLEGFELEDYDFQLHGGGALLPMDGAFKFVVVGCKPTRLGAQKRMAFEMQLSCAEETVEEGRGVSLYYNCIFGGKDKNGDPMSRNLGDLLVSSGFSKDEIRALGTSGKSLGVIADELKGKTIFGLCTAGEYNDTPRSELNQCVTEEIYEQKKPYRLKHAYTQGGAAPAKKEKPSTDAERAAAVAEIEKAAQGTRAGRETQTIGTSDVGTVEAAGLAPSAPVATGNAAGTPVVRRRSLSA